MQTRKYFGKSGFGLPVMVACRQGLPRGKCLEWNFPGGLQGLAGLLFLPQPVEAMAADGFVCLLFS